MVRSLVEMVPENPYEVIDIFVEEPQHFDQLYQRRLSAKAFDFSIEVVGKQDLISMKKAADREKDLFDIQLLEKK